MNRRAGDGTPRRPGLAVCGTVRFTPAAIAFALGFGAVDAVAALPATGTASVQTMAGLPAAQERAVMPSAQEAEGTQEPGGVQDTAAPPQVPVARARADRRIEEELSAVLGRIPGLEDVRAHVEAGVVVLDGEVLSPEDRALTERLASSMEQVLYVENRIETVTSLRSRLGAVLSGARARILDFVAHLPLLLVALLIVAAFGLLARWAGSWDRFYDRATSNTFAQNVLRQAVRGVVFLAGVVLALQLLEVTALVGALLGAAGIFGLAVGFAFRAIAENYLAGVFLSLRQPFAPNDHILMGGHEGKVVRLSARDTVLLTLEGNHLRIPNATVFGSVILNYTRNPRRRFQLDVSVGEDVDLALAQSEGVSALIRMEGLLEEPPPSTRVQELGDGVVRLRFFGWVDQRQHDFGKVRSEAIRLVKAGLDAAGISMPPTAYLVQMSEAAPAAAEPAGRAPRAAEGREARLAVPVDGVGDISVDRTIEKQIEADRRVSREEDLLDPSEAPPETPTD